MKRRFVTIISLLVIPLLSSCNQSNKQKEIRSDIAEFIAPFSVEKAVEAYKKTAMKKTVVSEVDGVKTETIETITFDITDTYNPQYFFHSDTFENDEFKGSSDQHFAKVDDQYFIVINNKYIEYTLEKCHDLVKSFFYKEVLLDGTYYDGGYYYGDIVKGSIYDYQDYITIDQENKTLSFSSCADQKVNGIDIKRCSNFMVDEIGMMTYNKATLTASDRYSETIIKIEKK